MNQIARVIKICLNIVIYIYTNYYYIILILNYKKLIEINEETIFEYNITDPLISIMYLSLKDNYIDI